MAKKKWKCKYCGKETDESKVCVKDAWRELPEPRKIKKEIEE